MLALHDRMNRFNLSEPHPLWPLLKGASSNLHQLLSCLRLQLYLPIY